MSVPLGYIDGQMFAVHLHDSFMILFYPLILSLLVMHCGFLMYSLCKNVHTLNSRSYAYCCQNAITLFLPDLFKCF